MSTSRPEVDDTGGQRRYGGRTPAERRAERRGRLLTAGLETFGTVGYADSSIEQLCADAKIATRSFYEEFPSKEALLIELHDDVNDRAFRAVGEWLEQSSPDDLEQRVGGGLRAYLDVMTQDPRWARIAFVEMLGATPATHAARRAALARFAALIEAEADRLADAGRIARRDYSLTATAMVGAITALVETWTDDADQRAQVERIADEASTLLLLVLGDDRS